MILSIPDSYACKVATNTALMTPEPALMGNSGARFLEPSAYNIVIILVSYVGPSFKDTLYNTNLFQRISIRRIYYTKTPDQ